MKSTAGGEKVALIIKRGQVKPASGDASTVVFVPGSNVTGSFKPSGLFPPALQK
ncbi:TPA: hypothetical protein RW198_004748 [Escherichia coli]|nr:hypothetical protein [Escherichia coli]